MSTGAEVGPCMPETTHSAATSELCTDDGKTEESKTMENNLREKFLKASDQIEKMIENDEVLSGRAAGS